MNVVGFGRGGRVGEGGGGESSSWGSEEGLVSISSFLLILLVLRILVERWGGGSFPFGCRERFGLMSGRSGRRNGGGRGSGRWSSRSSDGRVVDWWRRNAESVGLRWWNVESFSVAVLDVEFHPSSSRSDSWTPASQPTELRLALALG